MYNLNVFKILSFNEELARIIETDSTTQRTSAAKVSTTSGRTGVVLNCNKPNSKTVVFILML